MTSARHYGAIGAQKVLARLAAPLDNPRRALIVAMAMGLALVLLVPPVRQFFELDLPRLLVALEAVGIIAVALGSMDLGDRLLKLVRTHHGFSMFDPPRSGPLP